MELYKYTLFINWLVVFLFVKIFKEMQIFILPISFLRNMRKLRHTKQ